ncbi:MAG: hypothetical protein ABIK09_06075 [Pseudomonadota bacterium]
MMRFQVIASGVLFLLVFSIAPAFGQQKKVDDEAADAYLSPIRAEVKDMSAKEMMTKADGLIAEMRAMKDSAEARLRRARQDKDIERMDNINEALIALKGVLNLAEGYYYDLKSKADDAKAARTEFIKLRIAYNKMQELDAQIRAAGGPADQGVVEGRPVIQWTKDSDLPDMDPVEELEFWEVYLERPEIASPYH